VIGLEVWKPFTLHFYISTKLVIHMDLHTALEVMKWLCVLLIGVIVGRVSIAAEIATKYDKI